MSLPTLPAIGVEKFGAPLRSGGNAIFFAAGLEANHTAGGVGLQPKERGLSKLVRNVPLLNALEMTPFLLLMLFRCPASRSVALLLGRSGSNPVARAPPDSHESCRPTAPVRQSAACAPAADHASSASVVGSIILLPASNAATSHDRVRSRLLPPKCSAASVGPKRCSSDPEYFLRIRLSTRPRRFFGLPRFVYRPALPCFSPSAPRSRYRRHTRFACR